MLEIKNLHASVHGKEILKGFNLSLEAGKVHAIMGPNGAGKSTLGYVLSGREGYEITSGQVLFNGQDIAELTPEQRAALGIFLAFQYPVEIPGVNNTYFLRAALNAQRKARGEQEMDSMAFLKTGMLSVCATAVKFIIKRITANVYRKRTVMLPLFMQLKRLRCNDDAMKT